MTDLTIHNFHYFLEELEKNLNGMGTILEQEFIHLRNMHVLYDVMSKRPSNPKPSIFPN
jgi:hypothetical protein